MGVAGVFLPEALSVKYVNADKDWIWFWLFPSPDLSEDPWTKKIRRHHLNVNGVQQLVKRAALRAKITKPVTPHTLRHSCSSREHALRLPNRLHARLSRFAHDSAGARVLLRICLRGAQTYAPCKSCSDIRMSRPP